MATECDLLASTIHQIEPGRMVHQSRDDLVCPHFLHGLGDFGAKEELWVVGGQVVVHDTFAIWLWKGRIG